MITLPPTIAPTSPPIVASKQKPKSARIKPITMPFDVLVDHRERAAGWRFAGLIGDSKDRYRPLVVPTYEVHLVTADYVVGNCYIERKSHEDVMGSIRGGHKRFRAEHERLLELDREGADCFVIVESDLSRICSDLNSNERTSANSILGVLASWPQRYRVFWHFAGTREIAEMLALRIFRKWWEEHQEQPGPQPTNLNTTPG